eukprot:2661484-Alexandrium_andersonii.AAC.1
MLSGSCSDFPEETRRRLENAPAPEQDLESGRAWELLARPGPGGHVENEGHVDEFALRPFAVRGEDGHAHIRQGTGANEL